MNVYIKVTRIAFANNEKIWSYHVSFLKLLGFVLIFKVRYFVLVCFFGFFFSPPRMSMWFRWAFSFCCQKIPLFVFFVSAVIWKESEKIKGFKYESKLNLHIDVLFSLKKCEIIQCSMVVAGFCILAEACLRTLGVSIDKNKLFQATGFESFL